MKVFIISLPEQAERRKSAEQQMREAGVAFEFFDGIRGEVAIRECYFEGFDDAAFRLNTGRLVAIGELGCFASHRELWKRCAALDEPIMILEDDFNLLPEFAKSVRVAAALTNQVGFIRLQATAKAKSRRVGSHNGFELLRYVKAPHGLMCYCLSPAVAKHFVQLTRTIDAPVDEFTKKFWEHGQLMFALTPYSVAPSILSVETTIIGRKKIRKTPRSAWRRFLRKARWYASRWIFNLRYRLTSAPLPVSQKSEDAMRNSAQSTGV